MVQPSSITTAFGVRPLVYADYAASSRCLNSIEDYVKQNVLPSYSNTHTLTSWAGRQTSDFRNEARKIVKEYYNATHEDALIFCGSGSTGAVKKFFDLMDRCKWRTQDDEPAEGKFKFITEDRWGSYECTLCGTRLKNENEIRAHVNDPLHKNKSHEESLKISEEKDTVINRKITLICDKTAHHSMLLQARERVMTKPDITNTHDEKNRPK